MIAALYDIHGNLPALEAVLAAIRETAVTQIVVGGDVVPGPMPRECLELLRASELPTQFIRGNGDRLTLAARAGHDISAEVPAAFREVIEWAGTQIDSATAEWMSGWPATLRIVVPAIGDVLFCHATPRNDTDIFTKNTAAESLQPVFDAAAAALVVCGHTHMQFDRVIGATRVVNAGSVGMPFQDPGAYWMTITPSVQLHRTAYDLDAAAERIRSTPYPQAEHFAAKNVLSTPGEAVMLDAFARGK